MDKPLCTKRLVRLLTALSLALLALLAAQAIALADEGPRFKRLKVSIWPEYDAPSVLIMYQGDLADEVTLPTTVRYALPKGVPVHAAAGIDPAGQYLSLTPQVVGGDNPTASYLLDQRSTQFEFYFQPVEGAGRRLITYTVRAPGPTDLLQVEVQQPLRGTNFVAPPNAATAYSDKEGFQYQRYDYSNVAAGQEMTFQIGYDKPDAVPSVTPQQSTAAADQPGQYAPALFVAGLAVLMVGGFSYLRGRQRPAARAAAVARQKKRMKQSPGFVEAARVTASRPGSVGHAAGEARYCTKCGSRVRAEAVFCPGCGRPLKRRD